MSEQPKISKKKKTTRKSTSKGTVKSLVPGLTLLDLNEPSGNADFYPENE
jgi:hypothetical protein